MTKATSIAVMIALVALTACSKDSGRLDAAQESALMAAVAKGNWGEVERICTDWKAKEPKSPVATWLLFWAYTEQNKMRQADTLRDEWIHERRKKDAVTFAERIVKAHAESAVAWALLSNAQAWAGMKKDALESADRALSLDERCALAWRNKGFVLRGMVRREEVIKCYDKAIEIAPNYAAAWYNKGSELLVSRYEEAIKCYDKLIEINPSDGKAWASKGMVLRLLKQYNEAKECFRKAAKLGFPNAQLMLKLLEREGH